MPSYRTVSYIVYGTMHMCLNQHITCCAFTIIVIIQLKNLHTLYSGEWVRERESNQKTAQHTFECLTNAKSAEENERVIK